MDVIERRRALGAAQDVLLRHREELHDPAHAFPDGAVPPLEGVLEHPFEPVGHLGLVAEQVDLPVPGKVPRRDLHTADHPDAVALAELLGAADARHRVVVGQRDKVETGAFGIEDQVIDAEGTVGKACVTMQVADHLCRLLSLESFK